MEAVQKKSDFVRKSAASRSWGCLLLSQGAAMGCGVPYQHPLMVVLWGVLISRAVQCGTSVGFTAEQDNNHCTQSQPLPQRHCVPCWGVPWAVVGLQAWGGCSGSCSAAGSHRGHGQAGGATGGCGSLGAWLTSCCAPACGADSPSLGQEQGDPQGGVDPSGSALCPVLCRAGLAL